MAQDKKEKKREDALTSISRRWISTYIKPTYLPVSNKDKHKIQNNQSREINLREVMQLLSKKYLMSNSKASMNNAEVDVWVIDF